MYGRWSWRVNFGSGFWSSEVLGTGVKRLYSVGYMLSSRTSSADWRSWFDVAISWTGWHRRWQMKAELEREKVSRPSVSHRGIHFASRV